jgi:hypothetical protein
MKTFAFLKKLLRWALISLLPAFAIFVIGEQVESFRLGAIAACEDAKDGANCMRQKRYLAASPYYPDITRRLVGGYARSVGGALGASYAAPLPEGN